MKGSRMQTRSETRKKQKQEIGTETNETLAQFRPWPDLPTDILSSIAVRLTISDELSFRRTCQGFHSASTNIGSCRGPWILFQKTDSPECQIYNQNGSKIFKRNIPDLEGATCHASYLGWLLLSKEKVVFFFCPFSFAKITLPKIRGYKSMESVVAAFSDLPTSPHCMVSVINKTDIGVTVHVISKGKTSWTQVANWRARQFPEGFSFIFTATTFDHTSQSFCYFDSTDFVRTFAVKDKEWDAYYTNKGKKWIHYLDLCIPILPCYYTRHMFHDMIKEKRPQFDLEDDEYVSVCGLTYKDAKSRQVVYQNEVVDASPTKTSIRRAVWIQPRFYEAHMNLHW